MTIRPLRVVTAEVDSEMGELQDLLGSAEVAGLGQRSLARLLGPHVRVAADAAPHILGYIVAWALLTLAYHSATCGGRLGKKSAIWEAERRGPGVK